MTLRRRVLLSSLLVSLPVAVGLYLAIDWLRTRDRTTALERFVTSQMTEDVRTRCEEDPNWFLAGPRAQRPSAAERAQPDADALLPRPSTDPLPFEYFAYDEAFTALSSAGPRFPSGFRAALRSSRSPVIGPFVTPDGSGVQMAVWTGWTGSPCAVFLARLRPEPHQTADHVVLFSVLELTTLAVGLLVCGETVRRIRRVAEAARESAGADYGLVVPVSGRDEISAVAVVFNEAGVEIRRRARDIKDREDAFRRFLQNAISDVGEPLAMLEALLGDLARATGLPHGAREQVREAIRETHGLASRLYNLAAAARLKSSVDSSAPEPVDLSALVARVIERHDFIARAAEVTLDVALPTRAVVVAADATLFERAVNNLVDNAIRYNRPGGHVGVRLDHGDNRFSLRVFDDGSGVTDDVLSRLVAIRRFRGDEGRPHRSGDLGLGLAVVREVADRFSIQWAFRRIASGGFEAELTGTTLA
jgi:signal transduction histidine kinase